MLKPRVQLSAGRVTDHHDRSQVDGADSAGNDFISDTAAAMDTSIDR